MLHQVVPVKCEIDDVQVRSLQIVSSRLHARICPAPRKILLLLTMPSTDATRHLTEDDIYRASSQFRLWSFSPEKLATLRRNTHDLAVNRVRAQRTSSSNSNGAAVGNDLAIVTEGEELRLVQRYCEQIRATSDHFKWPGNVKVRSYDAAQSKY